MAKISEKASAKQAWYPPAEKMFLDDEEYATVTQNVQPIFAWRHMAYVLQSLVFEMMCEGSFKDATALMDYHIKKNLDAFRSDQLLTDSKSPNKMFYDSVRITGLKISSAINIGLISLAKTEVADEIASLKSVLVRNLICICTNSMLLKQSDNKHLSANIHHI